MKRLLYTVATGEFHLAQAAITHPFIRNYAHRHGADFLTIDESRRKFPQAHPSYEDLQIPTWLEYYDEIVHMDTDVLVTRDTPWLLDVSGRMMCATDELGLYYNNSLTQDYYNNYCVRYGLPTTHDGTPLFNWRYFNFGIFGVTRADSEFYSDFLDTCDFSNFDKMGIQTHINYHAVIRGYPIRDLGTEFNTLFWTKFRSNAYRSTHIIHYGGTTRDHQLMQIHIDIDILKSLGKL